MNVLTYFPFSMRYYLRHPIKFLKECKTNITNAAMRISRGWCWTDLWNMNDHLIELLPDMLRTLAEKGIGHPGIEPFDTLEKWHDWLVQLAADFESCSEKNMQKQNEYYEEYIQQFSDWDINTDLDKKYFAREQELYKEMQVRRNNCFLLLAKYFDMLWD